MSSTGGRNFVLTNREIHGDTVRPAARPFRGAVYLLASGQNSSAGYLMARFARESGAAVLVGEPSGGNYRGLNGGELAWVTLPASGVAVDIPLLAWMPLVPQPDASVQPHVMVRHTVADAQHGVDADIETVRRLIRGGRRQR